MTPQVVCMDPVRALEWRLTACHVRRRGKVQAALRPGPHGAPGWAAHPRREAAGAPEWGGVRGGAGAGRATCAPRGIPVLDDLISVGHEALIAPVEGRKETGAVPAVGLVRRDHLARYRLGEVPLDFITYFVRGH